MNKATKIRPLNKLPRAAGVGKGTVYSYFQTKKDLIKGFCEYELEKIHLELVKRSNQDASILEQMLTIYMTEFHHVTQNREFGRLYMRESIFPKDADVQDDMETDEKYFQMLFPILAKRSGTGRIAQRCRTVVYNRPFLQPVHYDNFSLVYRQDNDR